MRASSRMARRDFLAAVTMSAAAQGGPSQTKEQSAPAATSQLMGEPYDLAGNRLFFQSWYYIRPGGFVWKDQSGRALTLEDSVPPRAAGLAHVDRPFGIRLVPQIAERIGPLIGPECPWEENAGVYINSIIKDGGIYRGWGSPWTISGDPPGHKYHYYLESSDGLNWKRPNLGLVEVNGSRANNILNISDADAGSVFIDPAAPASERYKFVASGQFLRDVCDGYLHRRPHAWDPRSRRSLQGGAKGVKGAVSPDGLHWTMLRDPLVIEVTDTQIIAYYDHSLQKYVLYTRTWPTEQRSSRVPADGMLHQVWQGAEKTWQVGHRSIGRSETENFLAFPLHETVMEPGSDLLPADTLYANARTTMPGAPDHQLMFPTVWHTADDSTSILVASSHDGKVWNSFSEPPILTTGAFGAFDGGCLFAHPNLVELPDGRFALPYTGYNVPHKYPRKQWKFGPGYAIWPKGRLIALEASEHGEFATVGIVPPGRTLRINARTRRGGGIRVEVAGLDGEPLTGRSFAEAEPIIGDQHWAPVTWRGNADLGYQEHSGIMLRFRMDQVQLFGLEFV